MHTAVRSLIRVATLLIVAWPSTGRAIAGLAIPPEADSAASARTVAGSQAETRPVLPPLDIGSRWEPFVDRWLIGRTNGVDLRLSPPVEREVVLTTDKPWEGPDSAYYTVFQDGPRVRLYYRGYCPADASDQQVTCYAESADGVHFVRPSLGLYGFRGSKDNNIVYRGIEAHNFAPFLDRSPAAAPDARYKALGGVEGKLYAFRSPDGIHWSRLQTDPVLTKGAFDSLNIGFWDAEAKLYRCFSRTFINGVRAIQSCTSPDFVHWTDPQPNQYAEGAPIEHFYTNATTPHPDAPRILLSFPKRFVPERTKLKGYKEPGVSDAVFMSSRDGVHWDRTFLEAWRRPGPDQHNWTQRSNMPARGIVQLDRGEYSLYVSEHYQWPDNRLRRLTVRSNGFASVHGGVPDGEFVTKPLRFAGARLLLNYATSAAGSIRVQVQSSDGSPIPGFSLADMEPLFGDELEAEVKWKGGQDLAPLVGRTVRFRFVLRDADLYALRAAP